MTRTYTSRMVRHPRAAGRITNGDLRIAAVLGSMRAADRAIIQALRGLSRPRASARLRVLFDHGLTRAHVPRIDGPTWYTLTGAGARALAARFPEMTGVHATALPRNLAHHALIVRVWAAIAHDAARHHRVRLEEFTPAWRHDVNPSIVRFLPDGLVTFRAREDDGRWTVALEADTGAEEPTCFIRTKVRSHYGPTLLDDRPLYGGTLAALVVVGAEVAPLRRLACALANSGLGGRVLVGTLPALHGNVFTGGFATARAYATHGEGAERVGLDAVLDPEKQLLGAAGRNVAEVMEAGT